VAILLIYMMASKFIDMGIKKADSLPKRKRRPRFKTPNSRSLIIDQEFSQDRIVLIDAGYGNNASFDRKKLKYIGGL